MNEPIATIEELLSGFSPEAMVKEHPMAAVLTGFGIGFGLGLVVTTLLAPRRESFWEDHPVGSTMSDLSRSFRSMPHVNELAQALRSLPQSTAEHLASLLPRR